MNYQKHYDALIDRARSRTLACYKERHHILPRCMGGGDDDENLVFLTGPEHFVAHQLLVKLYPTHKGLIFSLNRMASHCNNNKVYGWIKIRMAIESRKQTGYWLGKKMPREYVEKSIRGRTGSKRSDETKKKMSLSATGNHRALGKKLPSRTPEHCAAISSAKKGKAIPAYTKEKRSGAMLSVHKKIKDGILSAGRRWEKGRIQSNETKIKRSESIKEWHRKRREMLSLNERIAR